MANVHACHYNIGDFALSYAIHKKSTLFLFFFIAREYNFISLLKTKRIE